MSQFGICFQCSCTIEFEGADNWYYLDTGLLTLTEMQIGFRQTPHADCWHPNLSGWYSGGTPLPLNWSLKSRNWLIVHTSIFFLDSNHPGYTRCSADQAGEKLSWLKIHFSYCIWWPTYNQGGYRTQLFEYSGMRRIAEGFSIADWSVKWISL
jgi:hypothetical protein